MNFIFGTCFLEVMLTESELPLFTVTVVRCQELWIASSQMLSQLIAHVTITDIFRWFNGASGFGQLQEPNWSFLGKQSYDWVAFVIVFFHYS